MKPFGYFDFASAAFAAATLWLSTGVFGRVVLEARREERAARLRRAEARRVTSACRSIAWVIARRTFRSANCGSFSLKTSRSTCQAGIEADLEARVGLQRRDLRRRNRVDRSDLAAAELQDALVVVVDEDEVDRVEVRLAGLPVVRVALERQRGRRSA